MLADAEPKVARFRKVLLAEFVFLHFEPALEDLFSLGAADSHVDCNFFVTADTESADGVAGFACGGCQSSLLG